MSGLRAVRGMSPDAESRSGGSTVQPGRRIPMGIRIPLAVSDVYRNTCCMRAVPNQPLDPVAILAIDRCV
jgi:hypothetical protein